MFFNKKKKGKIKVRQNGPYEVTGKLPLNKEIIVRDKKGNSVEWKKGKGFKDRSTYELCRCGKSKIKPYCDYAHSDIRFDGTETAGKKKFKDMAKRYPGPALDLDDARELCAQASFCRPKGGTWKLTEESNDRNKKAEAIKQCGDCPSGRLLAREKTGEEIEPNLEESLSIVEDPDLGVSGPIWVKGSVAIESADGEEYETRNRVTLCRCGESKNKPFCDGSHIRAGFNDGDVSLN